MRPASPYFNLSLNHHKGTWELSSVDGWANIKGFISCKWRQEGTLRQTDALQSAFEADLDEEPKFINSPAIRRSFRLDDGGLVFINDFVIYPNEPVCLIRMRIENRSSSPAYLNDVDFLSCQHGSENHIPNERYQANRLLEADPLGIRFYAQGWQSWSYAGLLRADESMPLSRLGPLSSPMQLCWGEPHPRRAGHFIADFFGAVLDTKGERGLLLGFLSQSQAFGRLEVDLNTPNCLKALRQNLEDVALDPGATFNTDWACISAMDLRQSDPMGLYLDLAAAVNDVKVHRGPVSGWSSWYCFGQEISADLLENELTWIHDSRHRVPLNLFQIDDGYQQSIGDWEQDYQRFPHPLSDFTRSVRASLSMAGIWLAPLIIDPRSSLYRDHHGWTLKTERGRPVNAGFGWGRFFKALDGSHPAVIEAIQGWVARAIDEWGFEYLKLDFLYAGALLGKRYDEHRTGAMVLRDVLAMIRETAGDDKFILACGCPLGSGLGLVDSMRISPDVSEHWRGNYKGVSVLVDRDPGFPSAWNAIRNSYYRGILHNRWWLNDPDCLILREADSKLSEDECKTLISIVALSGGVVIDSDPLDQLSERRVDWLARLIPPLNQRPRQPTIFSLDQAPILQHLYKGAIGTWSLNAIFNFDDSAREVSIESSILGFESGDVVQAFDVWNHCSHFFTGPRWDLGEIPAHGVRLLAVRKRTDQPAWHGDTIHLSQGLPVSAWEVGESSLNATIDSNRIGEESVWLFAPGNVRAIHVDGVPVETDCSQQDILSFKIQLKRQNALFIEWD